MKIENVGLHGFRVTAENELERAVLNMWAVWRIRVAITSWECGVTGCKSIAIEFVEPKPETVHTI